MKKNIRFPILLLALAVLLAGSYVLYDTLGKNIQPDQLLIQGNKASAESYPEATPDEASGSGTATNAEPAVSLAPDFQVYDKDGINSNFPSKSFLYTSSETMEFSSNA